MCAAPYSYIISNICFYHEGHLVIDKAKVQLPACTLPAELLIIFGESLICTLLEVLYGVPNKCPLSSSCSTAFLKSNTRHYYVALGLYFEILFRSTWDIMTSICHVTSHCVQSAESEVSIFLRIFSIYL